MTVDVVVFGKRFDVPPDLRAAAVEKAGRVDRFAPDVRRVDVDFAHTGNRRVADAHTCEILVHLKRHLVKAHASAADPHVALDGALEKIEQQLRRLHDKRSRGRRNGAARTGNGSGRAAGGEGAEALTPPVPGASETEGGESAGEAGDGGPTIVKTKQFAVKPMDPEEAALQMELLGHDFFLFTSAGSGRAAVVYRRRDGHFGLIESSG